MHTRRLNGITVDPALARTFVLDEADRARRSTRALLAMRAAGDARRLALAAKARAALAEITAAERVPANHVAMPADALRPAV